MRGNLGWNRINKGPFKNWAEHIKGYYDLKKITSRSFYCRIKLHFEPKISWSLIAQTFYPFIAISEQGMILNFLGYCKCKI